MKYRVQLKKLMLFLVFLFVYSEIFSQAGFIRYYSYENPPILRFNDDLYDCSYTIKYQGESHIVSGYELEKTKLSKPGLYTIKINSCSNKALEEELLTESDSMSSTIFIDTVVYQISINNIEKIHSQKYYQNETISFTITPKHFQKKNTLFKFNRLNFIGSGAELEGDILNENNLNFESNKSYTIKYQVNGILKYDGYYTIDLINEDGRALSIPILNKLTR